MKAYDINSNTGLIKFKTKFVDSYDKNNYMQAVLNECIELYKNNKFIDANKKKGGIKEITKYNKEIIDLTLQYYENYEEYMMVSMVIYSIMQSLYENTSYSNRQGFNLVYNRLYDIIHSINEQYEVVYYIRSIAKNVPLKVNQDIEFKKYYIALKHNIEQITSRILRIKNTLLPELISELPIEHYAHYLKNNKQEYDVESEYILYKDISQHLSDIGLYMSDKNTIKIQTKFEKQNNQQRYIKLFQILDDTKAQQYKSYIDNIISIILNSVENNTALENTIQSNYNKHKEFIDKLLQQRQQEMEKLLAERAANKEYEAKQKQEVKDIRKLRKQQKELERTQRYEMLRVELNKYLDAYIKHVQDYVKTGIFPEVIDSEMTDGGQLYVKFSDNYYFRLNEKELSYIRKQLHTKPKGTQWKIPVVSSLDTFDFKYKADGSHKTVVNILTKYSGKITTCCLKKVDLIPSNFSLDDFFNYYRIYSNANFDADEWIKRVSNAIEQNRYIYKEIHLTA